MRLGLKLAVGIIALVAAWWLAMDTRYFHAPERDEGAPASATQPDAPAGSSQPSDIAPQREEAARAARTPPAEGADQAPATAKAPQPAAQQAARAADDDDPDSTLVPRDEGPLDELARRFMSESRASDSQAAELRVKTVWQHPSIPAGLLKSVECRRTVCRVELRWTPKNNAGYVAGLTGAVGSFSAPLGIAAAEPPDSEGVRLVVAYFYPDHNVVLP